MADAEEEVPISGAIRTKELMNTLKPIWLARLLPWGKSEIAIHENTIQIHAPDGSCVLNISNLAQPPRVVKSYWLNSVEINKKKYWGFSEHDANKFSFRVKRHWYLEKFHSVNEFANSFVSTFQAQYLRNSAVKSFVDRAIAVKAEYRIPPDRELLPPDKMFPFALVEKLIKLTDSVADEYRKAFVTAEADRFKLLFDHIESNPLTEKQREACVTDDDNNMVLAGAGTGKTSTMVGKAGYLVESGRANADEILMLAFGNEAAKELQERINNKLGNPDIQASTFHALGKAIIAHVEGKSPSVSELATDGAKCRKFVDCCLQELLNDKEYERKAVHYFDRYLYPDINPFDFKTEGEYLDYLGSNEIRSLKGDEVKSYGELLIANFLFLNGIDYEYEKPYEKRTFTESFQQYRPDFYLTKYEIYLEYYGIDRNANTARYIDKQKYNAAIEWKRRLHENHGTTCLEAFHYEKMEGVLVDTLEEKLKSAGVIFDPIPEDRVLATLKEFGKISMLSNLLSELLANVKSRCRTVEEALAIAKAAQYSDQAIAALDLLLPILNQYDNRLRKSHEIDFNDMIHRAVQYVLDGRFLPRWKYILVDEFQDVASSRADLILALRDRYPSCSLFCVGDDWQSIYRFAGSDLSYTTRFGSLIGPYSVTSLDKTYRFNNSICDVASRFVSQNPGQVKKTLRTHAVVLSPAVSIMRRRNSYDVNHIRDVVEKIARFSNGRSSVFIISRYKYIFANEEFKGTVASLRRNYPQLSINPISMHASKGKEADYVIVVGLEKGKSGFPSEKITHPLLDLFLPQEESYPFAEERRLFYVAMTRAKHRVYIVADMEKPSIFMKELLQKRVYDICVDEFESSAEQEKFEKINCPTCNTGTLSVRINGQNGTKFVGCSHYSRCKHIESCCPRCSSVMGREGRFKICVACGWKLPMCLKCPGEMKKRPNGFWGCSNYRGKDADPTCTHTEKQIAI